MPYNNFKLLINDQVKFLLFYPYKDCCKGNYNYLKQPVWDQSCQDELVCLHQ